MTFVAVVAVSFNVGPQEAWLEVRKGDLVNGSRQLAWALVAAAFLACPLPAQMTKRLATEPSCPECRAELAPRVRLGGIEDPVGFGPLAQLAVNSHGEYVVSSPTFDGTLAVYDGSGRLLRTIGRSGSGPGEFERAQFLAFDASDSLHTLAMSGTRRSVFAPDLTFTRSVQLPARALAMELERDGSMYVVSPSAGPQGQHALQVFSPAGRPVASFDAVEGDASGPAAILRSIAVDGSGNRWSVGAASYAVRQWSPTGELVRQFVADREWISDELPMRLERTQRPPGQIGGLEFDESGLLWVFVVVADQDWSPPQQGSPRSPGETYDTLFEVIDPQSGTFISRGRSDELVLPFAHGLAYSMVDESTGDRRLQVWRMVVGGR